MTFRRPSVLIALSVFAATASRATPTFVGFAANTDAASGVRIDWSSDFGPDYLMHSNNPAESIPTPEPWGINSFEADRSLEMQVSRAIQGVGSVSAAGRIEIGAAGTVALDTVHTLQHDLTLANLSGQYGLFASTGLQGQFLFSDVSLANPVYWGIEWTVTLDTHGPGAFDAKPAGYAQLSIEGVALSPDPWPLLGDQTLTGSLFGTNTDGNLSLWSVSQLQSAGTGDLTWDIRVAFSTQAFNDIPDSASVPDTSAPGLFALALVALGLLRRRLVA